MKRKMLFITIPFIISLFIISHSLTSYGVLSGVLFLILIAFFIEKKISKKQFVYMILSWIFAFGIFGMYSFKTSNMIEKYSNGTHEFNGNITLIKEYASDKASYRIKGEFEDGEKTTITLYTDNFDAEYGDYIILTSDFKQFENTYLFDSKDYYLAKGITLEADDVKKIEITENISKVNDFIKTIKNYKSRITSNIIQNYGEDTGGIINAMMFGDKTYLDSDQKTAFYRTGIGHIMAVSGLHLAFLISILCFFLKKVFCPKKIIFLISVVCVVLFAICVDTPVSIIRAGIMIIMTKQADVIFRKNDSLNSLSLCAFVMLLIEPNWINDPSFLLSVSGTYGISVAAPYFTEKIEKTNKLKNLAISILSMACVSFCVLPFMALFFDETSIISPLTNIFMIPVCMIILFLSFVIFFTGGAECVNFVLSPILKFLVTIVSKITDYISKSDFSHISLGNEDLGITLFAIVFVVALIYFITKSRLFISIVVVLSIALVSGIDCMKTKNNYSDVKVAILGDYQNSASIITYKGHTFVCDLTGHSDSAEYITKYLQKNGINKVSILYLGENANYSASVFKNQKVCSKISSVMIPQEYENQLCNIKICDTEPLYIGGYPDVEIDDLKIKFKSDNIIIYYKNISFAITDSLNKISDNYNSVLVYAKSTNEFDNDNISTFSVESNKYINAKDIKYFKKHYSKEIFSSPVDVMKNINDKLKSNYFCSYNSEFILDNNGKIEERSLK